MKPSGPTVSVMLSHNNANRFCVTVLLLWTLARPADCWTSSPLTQRPSDPLAPCTQRGSTSVVDRRAALAAGLSGLASQLAPAAWSAAPPYTVISGTVTVKEGTDVPDAGALYVTVRLVPANNVGRYVSGGKVPPLATARFSGPIQFPLSITLSTDDLTPEFSGVLASEWESQDLIVSARLDTDGTAATRDPDDLVGRALLVKGGSSDATKWPPLKVELQGRGLTGRILTGR